MFADDTCLFLEVDDRQTTADFINEDLLHIGDWSNQWLVNFSPQKTKSLIISNKHDAQNNPRVQLFGHDIDEVDSHVYLGLKFACNLRWKHHINDVSDKTRKKLNCMVPFKYKLDRQSLEIMYKSFVLPTMEYANVVWGGSYDCDIAKLEAIHIDAMRLISGATARSHIENLYMEFNWLTIQERINIASLTIMYKIINGYSPTYLSNLIEHDENRFYNFRQQRALRMPFCRLEVFKKSFFPRTINLWNDLPNHLQSVTSLEEFKRKFKPEQTELLLLYYYGERWPSVHHARMRLKCSKLNDDLCNQLHVIDYANCTCGAAVENAQHYLLDCPNYIAERLDLANGVSNNNMTLQTLLFGNSNLSPEQNKEVFKAVHQFIVITERFQ